MFAETPLLLVPGSCCCCCSSETSDKRLYLIHILINMEPHFLRLRALGKDTIHQALSWAQRFLFTQPTVLLCTLPPAHTPLIPLSDPLPVTSCHFTHNKTIVELRNKELKMFSVGVCIGEFLICPEKQCDINERKVNGKTKGGGLIQNASQTALREASFSLCGKLSTVDPVFVFYMIKIQHTSFSF